MKIILVQKGNILMINPPPSTTEAYSITLHEKTQ